MRMPPAARMWACEMRPLRGMRGLRMRGHRAALRHWPRRVVAGRAAVPALLVPLPLAVVTTAALRMDNTARGITAIATGVGFANHLARYMGRHG